MLYNQTKHCKLCDYLVNFVVLLASNRSAGAPCRALSEGQLDSAGESWQLHERDPDRLLA